MKLPEPVKQTISRYVAKFPVPSGPPGEAHEENVRQWSIRLAEQVAFSHPNEGWGMKRAGDGRPISKDTLSRLKDGSLMIWDLLIGTGTGNPVFQPDPNGEVIVGQFFVVVEPKNHLGDVTQPPPTVPDNEVIARLDGLTEALIQLIGVVKGLNDNVGALASVLREVRQRQDDPLVGSIFGARVVLRRGGGSGS